MPIARAVSAKFKAFLFPVIESYPMILNFADNLFNFAYAEEL